MSSRIPITKAGIEALEAELKQLKEVERPEIIEQIAIARAHGDLSENAEYKAAREKQGFVEGRVLEIGGYLANAEIIDQTQIQSDKILFGATVEVTNEDGVTTTYQIVGEPEADLSKGRISVKSPIARALLGKSEGDDAIVKTPKGEVEYEIGKVKFV